MICLFLFRFIKLYDNMADEIMEGDDEILETRQDHHKEFMKTYIDTVKDRGKTSLSYLWVVSLLDKLAIT